MNIQPVFHHMMAITLPFSGQIVGSDYIVGFKANLPHRLVFAVGPEIRNSAGDLVSTGVVQPPVFLECWSTVPTADVNLDGFISGDDSDLYRKWFELGDIKADFNGDGFVTGEDFDDFQRIFIQGV